MIIKDMDADLATYGDFDKFSKRVPYWDRRFGLTPHTPEQAEEFKAIVEKHSKRTLSVLRAG